MKHILFCLLLFSTKVLAQKEGNWWFFGNTSSIDFSTPTPTVYTGSAMFTYDNASAVSDQNGQLLFYTNGVTVWNRFHVAMTNGTGLSGSNSGGQSALIVPQPNSNLYYVFTVPNHGTGALRYSVVDMTLSGGNGAVTLKNQVLHTPTTEKLDSYFDCINNRYKIVTHQYGNNSFYVYEVTASGINLTPVISTVGNVHSGGSPSSSHDAMGQLTISPDGSLIASGQQFNNFIQIFDFNITTGIVSNPRTIGSFSPWGLSFSRNGKMLYATHWINTSVDQIDLTNPAAPGAPITIGNVTGTTGGYGAGYLQLAPNDKIYIAKWASPYLSVIDSPNSLGAACNFIDNGLNLGSVVSQAGVCRTVTTAQAPLTILSNSNCTTTSFELNDTSGISAITWNFGAGVTSNLLFPTHPFAAGSHPVSAYVTRCNYVDTISTIITVTLNSTTSQFTATNTNCSNTVTLNNQSTNATTYSWNWGNGQTATGALSSYTYPAPGNYTISLIAQNGNCSDTSQQPITVLPSVVAAFTATADCNQGINITHQSQNGSNYTWTWGDGNTTTNNPVYYQYSNSGSYTISMIAINGLCSDTAILNIQVDTFPVAQINHIMSSCRDSVQFQSVNPSTSLSWNFGNGSSSTIANTSSYFPNSGNYTVTLITANSFCTDTTTLPITLPGDPNASTTYTLSCDGILSVNPVIDPAWTYSWYFGDGNTSTAVSPSHTYVNSGQYQLSLVVDNGFCQDSLSQTLVYATPNTYSIQSTLDSCSLLATFNLSPAPTDPVFWSFGDGSTSSSTTPAHHYGLSNIYAIQAIINPLTACADTIDYNLDLSNISSLENLFLPNSFTPNGDIVNDVYRIENISCDEIAISIYNRWGTLVFKSDNATKFWNGKYNGKDLPQGVYIIVAKNRKKTKTGTITLLR